MNEKIVRAIVWRLPRSIVYWAVVRAFAHGTTGPWSHTESPTLTVIDALERWRQR